MGRATYFVLHTIHTQTQRYLTSSRLEKEGVYADTMGIIYGDNSEYSLRFCHLVASDNLAPAHVWLCGIGESRIPDHVHFYRNLDPAFLPVAAHVQPDCVKTRQNHCRTQIRADEHR